MGQAALYDEDILLWSEQQAQVIRRLGQTRRDLPNEFDIENIAEEIESVGRSELASVESFLRLLMLHLIKIASAPDSPAATHWRDEARNFSADALVRFTPSMAERLNLQRAWRLASKQAMMSFAERGDPGPVLPTDCPFSVDDLVSEAVDLDALSARVRTDRAEKMEAD